MNAKELIEEAGKALANGDMDKARKFMARYQDHRERGSDDLMRRLAAAYVQIVDEGERSVHIVAIVREPVYLKKENPDLTDHPKHEAMILDEFGDAWESEYYSDSGETDGIVERLVHEYLRDVKNYRITEKDAD